MSRKNIEIKHHFSSGCCMYSGIENLYVTRINKSIPEGFLLPLGRTGKKELISLLKQIDGNENPFADFGNERFDYLDFVLQTRHNIIYQDRFSGTEETVKVSLDFLKGLVIYIDGYLSLKAGVINSIT